VTDLGVSLMPVDGKTPSHQTSGSLTGLHFGVKDLIDVEGWRTGGGNPHWLSNAKPASMHALCVKTLLEAGAEFKGKTLTDELAFSLEGQNHHYGTPLNPLWPDCLPGGSSSGSASAVAQKQVDFALGTDTGGSIRVPAAWCGLFGLRPTHNAVSLAGVIPFAPSYDCVGWLAQSLETLAAVSETLLPMKVNNTPLTQFYFVEDAFALTDPVIQAALTNQAKTFCVADPISVFDGQQQAWLDSYIKIQGYEIWQHLGVKIQAGNIKFGPAIGSRFAQCASITKQDYELASQFREQKRKQLEKLITHDGILVLPTTTCLPLSKTSSTQVIAEFYNKALCLNAISGHAGLPQLTVPVLAPYTDMLVLSGPVSLSFIAAKNNDLSLIHAVKQLLQSGKINCYAV